MNNRLLSEFFSMNSFSSKILNNFIMKRDFWGNFDDSTFIEKNEGIHSKISKNEVTNIIKIINKKNSAFISQNH